MVERLWSWLRLDAQHRLSGRAWAALLLLSVLVLSHGISTIPPMDRDESRYAQASRQMLETGDFVDIRFQDTPRHVKPVGTYWVQTATASLFGGAAAPMAAYRLPSLLAAVGTVLLTAWLGARLAGGAVGFLAGLMLACSVILGVEARTAKTDALLLFTVLVGQVALLMLVLKPAGERVRFFGWPLLFWVAQGAGILVKGPIITLVAGTTVLAFSVWQRDARWLARLCWGRGLPVMIAVVAPWLWAINEATGGAFFEEAIGHALLGKVAKSDDSHGAPPGYHTLMLLIALWPAALALVPAVRKAWAARQDTVVRVLLCWALPTFVVFEAVVTKLPHYPLPVYPAIAILLAMAVVTPMEGGTAKPWRLAYGVVAVLAVLVSLLLAAVPVAAPLALGGAVSTPGIVASVLGLMAAGFVIRATMTLTVARLTGALLAGGVFLAVTFAAAVPAVQPLWVTARLAQVVAEARADDACAAAPVALAGFAEPSAVFHLGTRTMLTDVEGAVAHLKAMPDCALVVVEAQVMDAFKAAYDSAPLETLAVIEGHNYSKGKNVALHVLAAAPEKGLALPTE